MSYTRFALYAVPDQDWLAEFGATWLGWDLKNGRAAYQFPIAGLDDITVTPRKYGFHGTLKPPFRLVDGQTPDNLQHAVGVLAGSLGPVETAGLRLEVLGGFLALTLAGDPAPLGHLAARVVRELDPFRAPPAPDELARRRAAGLSHSQEANLVAWGYPYVLADFRFHMTLTGRLPPEARHHWLMKAAELLPAQPVPFGLRSLALVGERSDGRFEMLHRYALTG